MRLPVSVPDSAPESVTQSGPSRRDVLRGGGAIGLASLLAGTGLARSALAQSSPGLVFPLVRGPYTNNGATPWYAEIPLGTPGQTLRFALDTGSNFIWTTSSLCAPTSCTHLGHGRFDYQRSSTFSWIDQTPQNVSFGPWGNMVVETGRDLIGLPNGKSSNTSFYLTKDYSGAQFAQLDWDGGIGFPSGTQYVQPGISFFMADLMNAGMIDPEYPYVSFTSDTASQTGSCRVGGFDTSQFNPDFGIYMPWTAYTQFPDVAYIWSTPLQRYAVGGQTIAQNVQFCLDSGSSQFKGDDNIMNTTLAMVAGANKPVVDLYLGQQVGGGGLGQLAITPDIYEVLIQAGPDQGKVLPQFNPLGLTNLVLVGSVLMDYVYSIFEYSVSRPSHGYQLQPVGIWVFAKTSGLQLVASRSHGPHKLGPRPVQKQPAQQRKA